ncbi:hypothetical protein BGZ79_009898 [Entomortierella chlamydospora]|nr:hypothetical protein BGZ79_009898 [Entomortierella chlamydospora]
MLDVTLSGLNSNSSISGSKVNINWTTNTTTTWSSILTKLIQDGGDNSVLQTWTVTPKGLSGFPVVMPIIDASEVVHFELMCSAAANAVSAALCGQSPSFNLYPEATSTAQPGVPAFTALPSINSRTSTTPDPYSPSSAVSPSNIASSDASSATIMGVPVPAFLTLLALAFTGMVTFMVCVLRCRQAGEDDFGEIVEKKMHQPQRQSLSSRSPDLEQGPPIIPPWSLDFEKSKYSRFFGDDSSSMNELLGGESWGDSTRVSSLYQHPDSHLHCTRILTPSPPPRIVENPLRRGISVIHLNKASASKIGTEGELEDVRIDSPSRPSPAPSRASVRRHDTLTRQIGRRNTNEGTTGQTWPRRGAQFREKLRLSLLLSQYFDGKSSTLDVSEVLKHY